jgi:hypothetical protein
MPVMQPQSASFLTCPFLPSPTNLDLIPCVPSFTLSPSQTEPRAEEDVKPRDWIGLDGKQPGTRSRGGGREAAPAELEQRHVVRRWQSSPTLGDHHFALEVPALSPPPLRACQAVLQPKRFCTMPPNPFPPSPFAYQSCSLARRLPRPLPPPRRRRPLRGRLRP